MAHSRSQFFKSSGSLINMDVAKLEDQAFRRSDISQSFRSLNLSDKENQPQRPAFGTQGNKIQLLANYFQLIKSGEPTLFHWYSVDVQGTSADAKPKGKKLARVIKLFIEEHLSGFLVASDYSATIILGAKHPSEQEEFSVNYCDEGNNSNRSESHTTYRVLLRHSKSLDSDHLLTYLQSVDFAIPDAPGVADIIQAMNIMLGYNLKGATSQIMSRANKYTRYTGTGTDKEYLEPGAEIHRGYAFSVRPATGRILLNVQVKHQAMLVPQALPSLIREVSMGRKWDDEILRTVERIYKGVRVKLIQFTPPRNKIALGFATPEDGASIPIGKRPRVPCYGATAEQVQILVRGNDPRDQAKWMTVSQYFKKNYNRTSQLPVINTGTRGNPVYTIAEVCQIPPAVPYRARLSTKQSQKMIDFAVRVPYDNATSITGSGVEMLKSGSLDTLKDFGWSMDKSLVKVEGRTLSSPTVMYATMQPVRSLKNASWNMSNNKFVEGTTIPRWQVIWVTIGSGHNKRTGGIRSKRELDEHIDLFCRELVRCGVTYGAWNDTEELNVPSENDCDKAIQDALRPKANSDLGLLLFVLPVASTHIYNAIKKAGDIDFGIHTVCVVKGKFCKKDKANTMYFANVALKFNLKLGGRNQALRASDLGFISQGKTMLVGIDVTHPAPGEDKAPSVASIVASTDKHCAQWPAYIHIQQARQEVLDNSVLKVMMKNRLAYWQKLNKSLPEQILVYRDGVSEGQHGLVRNYELTEIREACKELYSGVQQNAGLPRITMVIVGKRHNTRFYSGDEKQGNQGNPPSGTIVDRGITEARTWDFFLQAHVALKGTARPAHYVAVHDEIFRAEAQFQAGRNDRRTSGERAADSFQSITHNLCYMYGRATKAVSICPPAYYADLACDRARRWLSRLYSDYNFNTTGVARADPREVTVHPRLENTMFYI